MINFDSLTLKALLNEITPIIENARIQKIRQPNRQELIFTIRNNSKNHTLFISIKPAFAHICLLEEKYKQYSILETPKSPPMFCMLLRKYLENSKIEKVIQPKHERIIEFHFTSFGELGEKISLILAVELMGKHSNIILYNADSKNIIGCAHNVGEEKSKYRELAGNLNYVYPPKIYKKDILKITDTDFLDLSKVINNALPNWLNETFYDISIPIANEVCKKVNIPTENNNFIIDKDKLLTVFNYLKDIVSLKKAEPSTDNNCDYFSVIGSYNNKYKTINEMIDCYFAKNSYSEILERKRKSLSSIVNREIKKIQRLKKKLSVGIEYEEKILLYKQIADTLMANLHNDYSNLSKVELINIHTNENITIELDNTISTSGNAQNYYKLYSKSKKTKETNEQLFIKYNEKEEYLKSIILSVNFADNLEIIDEIEEEINSYSNFKPAKNTISKAKKNNIEQITIDDYTIYIGKNNKQNDYIVSKLSAPDDFWFHIHNDFGSHVLVKTSGKTAKLPDKIILKAAELAAKFSAQATNKKVDIIYTKRKYIKKPPGANLGHVTYKNEKEITVENTMK